MDVGQALAVAYLADPVDSAIGWAPQLVSLARDPASAAGVSVETWALWSVSGLVALGYVAVVVGDRLLVASSAVTASGQLVVLGFALAARVRRREPAGAGRASACGCGWPVAAGHELLVVAAPGRRSRVRCDGTAPPPGWATPVALPAAPSDALPAPSPAAPVSGGGR